MVFPNRHIVILFLFKHQSQTKVYLKKSEDFQKSHIVMLCLLKLFNIAIDFCFFTSNYCKVQGAVASWLVPLSPDRVIRVPALA